MLQAPASTALDTRSKSNEMNDTLAPWLCPCEFTCLHIQRGCSRWKKYGKKENKAIRDFSFPRLLFGEQYLICSKKTKCSRGSSSSVCLQRTMFASDDDGVFCSLLELICWGVFFFSSYEDSARRKKDRQKIFVKLVRIVKRALSHLDSHSHSTKRQKEKGYKKRELRCVRSTQSHLALYRKITHSHNSHHISRSVEEADAVFERLKQVEYYFFRSKSAQHNSRGGRLNWE